MMRCKSCDAEVQPGQMFCVNCGARTEGNTYTTGSTVVLQAPSAPDNAASAPAPPTVATPPAAPSPPPYAPGYNPPAVPGAATSYPTWSETATATTSTMAVVSLVCGIVGWFLVPFFASIAAIITGHMARREIRASNGQISGDGMAIAGLILGYSMVVLSVLACGVIFILVLIGAANGVGR